MMASQQSFAHLLLRTAVTIAVCAGGIVSAGAKPKPLWIRLPLGKVPSSNVADEHPGWWKEASLSKYMDHNILQETKEYDPHFRRDLIVNDEMRHAAPRLTNGQRRHAILQCLVALNTFMNDFNKSGETSTGEMWWLEAGTLIGAVRGKAFIPWDDDADVTMTQQTWQDVVDLRLAKLWPVANVD